MKYAFIEKEEQNHSIALMCCVLEVSRSGYYKWKHNGPGVRKRRHEQLVREIRAVFERSRRTYGVRRVHAQLKDQGQSVNRKVVEKLMHEHHITPKRRRRFKRTTDSNHDLPISANHLNRQFAVTKLHIRIEFGRGFAMNMAGKSHEFGRQIAFNLAGVSHEFGRFESLQSIAAA